MHCQFKLLKIFSLLLNPYLKHHKNQTVSSPEQQLEPTTQPHTIIY